MAARRRVPPSAARLRHPKRRATGRASMARAAASVRLQPSLAARRPAKPRRASPRKARRNERFLTLYPKADRHLALGLCGRAGGSAGLLVVAGVLPAASRFSD